MGGDQVIHPARSLPAARLTGCVRRARLMQAVPVQRASPSFPHHQNKVFSLLFLQKKKISSCAGNFTAPARPPRAAQR
jgi:hypothetical protein